MVDLANKIKLLRYGKQLTQQQVAERIGISKVMVSPYELSRRLPSYDTLVKLAIFFGVSVYYLLSLEKSRSINFRGLNEKQVKIIADLVAEFKNYF